MTAVVVDASVVIKWLLPERDGEVHVGQAASLLRRIGTADVDLYQPPHWLAEAAAVVARLSPETAARKVVALQELRHRVIGFADVYGTACALSIELDHHLFDTLYHAVALHMDDAVLVTADERYHRKAASRGRIRRLGDLPASDAT